ncbi:MAG TPA: hypothetical protein VK779_01515 [Rhizomicrobium sp.]|jgi:hypothetical protein|nr:hypothetical protein [Rhizomicrobium sp.]
MLRNVIIAIAAVSFVGGLAALLAGACPPGFVFAFWGALLLLGTIYERVIYKPVENATPGGSWVRTAERFMDDRTGKPVTVYVDPKTGERKYVQE